MYISIYIYIYIYKYTYIYIHIYICIYKKYKNSSNLNMFIHFFKIYYFYRIICMLVYVVRPPCARHAPMVKMKHRQDKCPFIYIFFSHHPQNADRHIYIYIYKIILASDPKQ